MIRCGKARWDAKDKICTEKKKEPVAKEQTPPLLNTDLEKLIAEREKLNHFWNQK